MRTFIKTIVHEEPIKLWAEHQKHKFEVKVCSSIIRENFGSIATINNSIITNFETNTTRYVTEITYISLKEFAFPDKEYLSRSHQPERHTDTQG